MLQVLDVVNLVVMFEKLNQIIDQIDFDSISSNRKTELEILTTYIQSKKIEGKNVKLNFICTHNSRRSQFSQIWAKVASDYYQISADCYSGGVEETEFNTRAVSSLKRFGFEFVKNGQLNPKYKVTWNQSSKSIEMFSKLYDDPINPSSGFAAIMTCSHADENCPHVMGCDQRIPIRYEDPKKFDNTPLETVFYDYRSFQIATEMFYVFSKIN